MGKLKLLREVLLVFCAMLLLVTSELSQAADPSYISWDRFSHEFLPGFLPGAQNCTSWITPSGTTRVDCFGMQDGPDRTPAGWFIPNMGHMYRESCRDDFDCSRWTTENLGGGIIATPTCVSWG